MSEKEVVLRFCNVSKAFGRRKVLKNLSFEAYAGEVFGFLGPNGAGKTTTIKLLTGLLTLDEGDVFVMGYDMRRDFESAMAHVGGIVENPEFYNYMSGLDNLKLFASVRGVGDTRIWELVRLVGMEGRIRDKVGKYSLGMRQRLGIAMALLHRPRLLVLDEPTNGLDPSGIKALREILVHLAHTEGIAVFVSSHLMSEMEMMCDRVGVIVNGELESVKTIDEIVSVCTDDTVQYAFSVDDPLHAEELLRGEDDLACTVDEEGRVVLVTLPAENAKERLAVINRTLILGGVNVFTVSQQENRRLEDVFIEMTAKGGNQID